MFAASIDGPDVTNTVNYIRLTMKNTGATVNKAAFTSAYQSQIIRLQIMGIKGIFREKLFLR